MKHCNRCNTTKNETEFYKCNSSKDGLQSRCKTCRCEIQRLYRSTEDGHAKMLESARQTRQTDKWKAYTAEYNQRPEVKARLRKRANDILQTNDGKEAAYKLNHSSKAVERRKEYKKKQPRNDKAKCYTAICHAVSRGKIQPASDLVCVVCGNPAEEYHHHLGYSKEHRMDVKPVCKSCHSLAHRTDNPIVI